MSAHPEMRGAHFAETRTAMRAKILAMVRERHQVREVDLCEEFHVSRVAVVAHLKALGEDNLVHRVTPMNVVYHRQQVGQVWMPGPGPERDRGTAEPLQVSTRKWQAPTFQVSMLERLLFPSYGVSA